MKRLSFFLALAVCVGVFLTLNASPAFAQGETGSVTGVVTDPQGGTVAGADVTLTDVSTKSARTATTNDAGRFHFASVAAGNYDLTISKSGFKIFKAAAQRVSVGTQLTVDVALEVGALTETVVVTSQAGTELQTANASIGNTISLKDLEMLPNLGRDASTLMALQPGVTPLGNVAGAVEDQSTFTVDGGTNTDDMSGDTRGYITNFTGASGAQTNGMASGVVATPIETVEEFKVNTFGQTADFNSSAGAQVQMVTKRGTGSWHGSGYGYYFAPNIWGAQTWALNHTPFTKGFAPDRRACAAGTTWHAGDNNCVMPSTPLIPNHRDRFGVTIGGPMIPWKILGGKTYLFAAYEGFRFPNSTTFERAYPTDAFRKGVIQVPDANNVWQPYNLNPFPITVTVGNPLVANSPVRTVTLPAATAACPTGYTGAGCDPRGLGLNSTVSKLWGFLPTPNDPTTNAGDQFNTQGYLSTIRAPLTSNNYVGRIDHDFNSKQRFFTSFRAFKLLNVTTNQVDVGGILGGTKGSYNATAPRPQLGELLVFGLTSTLKPTLTNDLRLSYLWNWWQWGTAGGAPQFAGLGGALEIAAAGTGTNAEATTALIPYNVNNQSVRQRVWDGQDKQIRDDVTWVKGNHLFQFGGLYLHNFDYHNRTDNGGSINNAIVYQIAVNGISFTSGCGTTGTSTCLPGTSAVPTAQQSRYRNLTASVLGLVGLTQVMYTRAGADLHLLPLGSLGVNESVIKTYNLYFADTWKIKPTLTVNYGLGYAYETPPVEKNGNQVEFVYADGSLVHTVDYLAKRKAAALAGQVYNPTIGYETAKSLKIKYPYTPFRKGISPRISVAWNPNFKSGLLGKLAGEGKTVIRAGYGRVYGRLNGVNQVLVPLLGPGILQAVSCSLAVSGSQNCGFTAGGTAVGSVNPGNVFRIGTDGLTAPLPAASATLPQPFLPGINGVAAGDAQTLDPDFRPNATDNVDFTIQREISRKVSVEVGYIGRRIRHEYQQVNLNAIPYMTTLGGQQFAQAYANLYTQLNNGVAATAVTPQAFFEAALAKSGGTFCAGFSSCTVAIASNSTLNAAIKATGVSTLWNGLQGTNSWVLPNATMTAQVTSNDMVTSLGSGNYNAAFATLRMRDWHGMTAISNLTWGRALGTTALTQRSSSVTPTDPFDLSRNYGTQSYDLPLIFNLGLTYQPKSFFGLYDFQGKHGILGQLLNGWSISPFFTAQSGFPIAVSYSEGSCTACQAFGENAAPGVASISSDAEDAVFAAHYTGGNQLHRGVVPATGPGSSNSAGLNMFGDPAAILAQFRPCVLGIDHNCGGWGNIRGFKRWNVDATLAKDFRWKERMRITVSMQFTNVFNHFQPSDPSLSLSSSQTFGVVSGQVYNPRQTEFGLRIAF
jgi:hypothetical protein